MPSEARARRSAAGDALAALLFPGGRPSWEHPELTSLGTLPPRATLPPFPTPELAATLDRTRSRWLRSLDGAWEFRLVDRPDLAPPVVAQARGWRTRRRAEPLDDARRRVSALHERRHALRHAAPLRARAQPDGALPPRVHRPARLGSTPTRAAFRRRRRGAPRARQRTTRRHGQGRADTGRVRCDRPRRPDSAHRGARRGGALVRCELRRGSGPVVARRHLPRGSPLHDRDDPHRGRVRPGGARRRLPERDARNRRERERPGRRSCIARGAPARSERADGLGHSPSTGAPRDTRSACRSARLAVGRRRTPRCTRWSSASGAPATQRASPAASAFAASRRAMHACSSTGRRCGSAASTATTTTTCGAGR